MEATPKHLIIVDGAILQPIPEHPKRDFIFCLSTAFGDAYLFQVVISDRVISVRHCPVAGPVSGGAGQLGEQHPLRLCCSLRQAPREDWHSAPPPGNSYIVTLSSVRV